MEIDDELVAERELKQKCFHVWNTLRKKAVFIRTFGALPRFAVPTPEYDRRCMEFTLPWTHRAPLPARRATTLSR